MSEHVVQCARRRVNVQLLDREDGAFVRCPGCERTATRDEALETAKDYAIAAVARQFNDELREIAARRSLVGYRPIPETERRHEWVLAGL